MKILTEILLTNAKYSMSNLEGPSFATFICYSYYILRITLEVVPYEKRVFSTYMCITQRIEKRKKNGYL